MDSAAILILENESIIIMLLCAFVLLVIALAYRYGPKASSTTQAKRSNKSTFELSFGEKRDSHDNSFFTKMSGVTHWNTPDDIGCYWGCIYHDKNNKYDKNAIAIFSIDGKQRGFIPKEKTKDLREWCNRNYLPCLFYIAKGDDAPLYGNVLVIDSDPEGVKATVLRQTRWIVDNYGVKFIPDGLDFTFDGEKPKTKEQWIDFLDELLADCED